MTARFRAMRAPGGLLALAPAQSMSLRRDVAGAAITTLAVTIFFVASFWDPVFTGDLDGLVGRGDTHLLNGPKNYFLDARLRNGEFPLWDPMQLGGTPYAAHPLAMAFYPPNLARAYLADAKTPEDYFYSFYAMLYFHFLVGGWGMYLLSRREGVSVMSSVVTAVGVAFCERWVLNGIYQAPLLCTVAWVPLVFAFLSLASRSSDFRRGVGWALLAGIGYGFQILGGWTQASIYATIGYVVYLAFLVYPRAWAVDISRRAVLRATGQVVALNATFGITGALVACALMLPAVELIGASARSVGHFGEYTAELVNLPSVVRIQTLMEGAAPGILGQGRALAEGIQYSFSQSLGLMAIAIASVFLLLHLRVLIHFVLTYIFFDLTFGPPMPFSALLDAYAPFAMSTPAYQTVLVSVPVGVLAGFALDKTLAQGRSGPLPLAVVAILLAAGALSVVFAMDPYRPIPVWTFAGALLPAGIILLVTFGRPLRHWPVLMVLALLLEVYACSRFTVLVATRGHTQFVKEGNIRLWMMPFVGDWGDITSPPDDRLRRPRVTNVHCNGQVWGMESAMNGYDPVILRSAIDSLSTPGQERVYKRAAIVDGNVREQTLMRRPFWLAKTFVRGVPPEKTRRYPPTDVVYLESSDEIALPEAEREFVPDSVVSEAGEEIVVWRREDAGAPGERRLANARIAELGLSGLNAALRIYYESDTPKVNVLLYARGPRPLRLFSTGQVESYPDENGVGVIELPLPDFGTLDLTVRLSVEEGEEPAGILRISRVEDLADEGELIEVRDSLANKVTVGLSDLPGARALVFTEMNYPGWKATLDGEPAPILNANGPYKAVIVPAGTHEVVFMFRPWRVYAGVAISVTALVAALGASMYLLLRRRRPDGEASPAVDTPSVV